MATAGTTAPTNGRTRSTTEAIDIAQKTREQLISTIQQGQELSVGAAKTWAEAMSALPIPNLAKVPGVPALPIDVITRFVFDLAADLLNAQREYVLQMVNVFTSPKSD